MTVMLASLWVLYSAWPASEHFRSSGTTSESSRPMTACVPQMSAVSSQRRAWSLSWKAEARPLDCS